MNKYNIGLLFLFQIYVSYAANILAISSLPAYSHFKFKEKFFKSLARKGHSVDFYSHFPQNETIPGYSEFSLKGSLVVSKDNFSLSVLEKLPLMPQMLFHIVGSGLVICPKILEAQAFKDLRFSKKKYDLLITEIFFSECILGFGHLFKIPVIQMGSSVTLPWISPSIGNSENPSYIPTYYSPLSSDMSLMDRVYNVYIYFTARLLYPLSTLYTSQYYATSFFGSDLPNLQLLQTNVSLIMVNSHHSINQARPLVPKLIEIGGIHIDRPKPLPNELERIIVNGASGVIYFALGSIFELDESNLDRLESLFWAFSKMPYTVICKGDTEKLPNHFKIPRNVYFKKWLPQLDLLCHNRTKLFISHGGPMSMQESAYCGVPVVNIPFFGDQHHIAHQVEAKGFGYIISRFNITKYSIYEGMLEVLNNYRYKENAEKISILFRDRPQTPLETALYWTEYVIKHRGAPHLQTVGASLSWYQYYLIDVALVFIILLVTVVLTLRMSLSLLSK